MNYKDEITHIYDSDPQNEWERMDRHRTEFAVTLRALDENLPPPPARILDCGGGPGRYAIELAQRGYQVTLFDLSTGNLELAKQMAVEAGVESIGYAQGTATDLSQFESQSFDAVLLMGPLYHLLDENDRRNAVSEAYRVLRSNGVLFAIFLPRYSPLRYSVAHALNWPLELPEHVQTLVRTGSLPPRGISEAEFVAHFAHPAEVKTLIRSAGFEIKTVLGVEGLVSQIEAQINQLSGEAWDFWLDLNYQVAPDPSIHGAVEHLLAIAIKPRWRRALRKVAAKLNDARIPYKVVGGTVTALYGIATPVNDVDIEFSAEDVYRAENILAEFMTNPVEFKESEFYRSHIGHLEIDSQLVEIFGQLERRQSDKWISSSAVTHNTIKIEGVTVQIPWLEEETLSYIRRGKLDRAALCLPHCDPERLRALLTGEQPTNVI